MDLDFRSQIIKSSLKDTELSERQGCELSSLRNNNWLCVGYSKSGPWVIVVSCLFCVFICLWTQKL